MTDLILDRLVAHRGRPLFSPISEQFSPGMLIGIVGPNGTGKSSLLSAIIGRGIDYTGTASYGGSDLSRLRPRQLTRVLSYVGQDTFAPNDLRVRDVVGVGARAAGRHKDSLSATYGALERLGIASLADRSYARLSGGERQLVQVARSLAQDSPIMLLDEPTSALDLRHQLTVLHALKERADAGHIVVVTIHDLTQAMRWADRVAVITPDMTSFGAPADVLTPDLIRRVYGVTAEVFDSPSGSPTLSLVRRSCPTATTLTGTYLTAS